MTESLRNNFDEVVDRNVGQVDEPSPDLKIVEHKAIEEPKQEKDETIDKDQAETLKTDDFMKAYLEKQRRKSMAIQRDKENPIQQRNEVLER